jgi:hypothetical protein
MSSTGFKIQAANYRRFAFTEAGDAILNRFNARAESFFRAEEDICRGLAKLREKLIDSLRGEQR